LPFHYPPYSISQAFHQSLWKWHTSGGFLFNTILHFEYIYNAA
jgi:hypothetical protein